MVFIQRLEERGHLKCNGRSYKDIGGEIIYNSEVAKIDVQQSCTKGLFLKNGKYFKSNIVVSNGDTAWTYTHFLDKVIAKVE